MSKRILTIILALALTVSTIGSTGIEANAVSLSEDYEEAINSTEETTIENVDVEDRATEEDSVSLVWNKLYSYAASEKMLLDDMASDEAFDETSKDEVSTDEAQTDKSKMLFDINADSDDSSQIEFSVQNENVKIQMIVNSNLKNSVIIYTDLADNSAYYSVEVINEKTDINVAICEDEDVNAVVGDILDKAVEAWSEMLASVDLTWADLGFVLWNEWIEENSATEEGIVKDETELAEDAEAIEDNDAEEIADEESDAVEITDEETEIAEEVIDEDVVDELLEEVDEETVEEEFIGDENLDTLLTPCHAERIEVTPGNIKIRVGESVKVNAKIYPEFTSDVLVWDVEYDDPSDYNTLTNDGDGVFTACKMNQGRIYVVAKAGLVTTKVPVEFSNLDVWESDTVDENGNPTFGTNLYGEKIVIADGIWVGGFKKSGLEYTGKAVTQDIRVYNKGELLTLNKDYSLAYRNNVIACDSNLAKSPSVTITMKGQYSGKKTLYYAIEPATLTSDMIDTNMIALNYNGREQKYVPIVSYNGKRLVNNKDFTIDYSLPHDFKGNETYPTKVHYTLTGKGNFKGNTSGYYYISPQTKNINKATITLKASVTTTKSDLSDIDAKALGIKVKLPGERIAIDPTDDSRFSVNVSLPSNAPGTGKVFIMGTGNLIGYVTKTFRVTAAYNLARVAETNEEFEDSKEYYPNDSYNKQTSGQLLSLKDSSVKLQEGVDYVVSYSAINRPGVARITFKGINAYSGTISKTYKLVDTSSTFTFNAYDGFVTYTQGGTKTNLQVFNKKLTPLGSYEYWPLIENVDYTVKYVNNNKVGQCDFTVIPKGKYVKLPTISQYFYITPADIAQCTVSVPDKIYATRKDAYKSVPVITAPNGKRLVAGKDYDKNFIYDFDDSDINDIPASGATVKITINGIGNYEGSSVTACYRVFDNKVYAMSKLFIAVDNQTYTGSPVILDLDNDVHVYGTAADMKNKINELTPASDYVRVVSYKNNIKAGNAIVVLGGAFNSTKFYGGTKNVTFKILKKNYDTKPVTGVSLDKSVLELKCVTSLATGTIKANIAPLDADNQNLMWTNSNPKIARIVSIDDVNKEAHIEAVTNGSCVITCTTQEGAKVAKCTVKVVMKPVTGVAVFDTSNNPVSGLNMLVGDSIDLIATFTPTDAYVPGGYSVLWKTSNMAVVTVNSDGHVIAEGMGMASISATIGDKTIILPVSVNPSGTLTFVNVTTYGATPNDTSDDTVAFNNALKAVSTKAPGERNLYVPAGTYNIKVTGEAGLDMNNAANLYIKMESGAVLKTISSGGDNMRGVICLDRAQNVIFEGGTIDGNRSKIGFSEDNYGIMCVRSKDIQFKDMTVKNVNGDGIYLGKDSSSNPNRNIFIKGCTVSGCARNNIAIVNAVGVTIDGTKSVGATGYHSPTTGTTASGLGLDIEPNSGQIAQNINVSNCTFTGNREEFGIHCHVAKAGCSSSKDITLDRCSFGDLIYIDCGTNLNFTNTVKKPARYYDRRNNSYVFPD